MDAISRFIFLFTIFFVSVLVIVVLYATYFLQNEYEILTPSVVIIVLLLIVLCNLLPKRNVTDFDNSDSI
jgi:branched-subunit amino acid permease